MTGFVVQGHIYVFIVTFYLFNAFLLNKSINFFQKKNF